MQQAPLPPWQERLPLALWRGLLPGAMKLTPTISTATVAINSVVSVASGPLASMPGSTEWFSAAMQRPRSKWSNASRTKTAGRHRAPLARWTARVAGRHRWQRQLVGPALETAFGQLRSAGGKPQNAVVPSPTPAMGASRARKG